MTDQKMLAMILISMAVTYALRAFPFVLLGKKGEMSPVISYLGKMLPYAVMAALVVYCLKDLREGLTPEAICMIPAVLVVTAVHLWKRNTVLSIFVGTVCYMVLIRVFA